MTPRWTPTRLVAADDSYDVRNSSDSVSRFGAYLRQNARPDECADAPVSAEEFAAVVWRTATAPVMSPGYVRLRPDVAAVTPTWSEDGDGRLMFDVHVPLQHNALVTRQSALLRWADWQTGPRDPDARPYRPLWTPERAVDAVLTTTTVRLAVTDDWALPAPSGTPARLVTDAKGSVAAVADSVNRFAGPIVAALRGDAPC
ncbi:hypothetical protein [Streptantibioticus silvisoli]|uniref:Uncharacterized protein n=1 Tax=Streptantibioticus silvisoli TaxID=2705255 RepID=A0ABT6W8S0_9ACTN|nr:hypothetical protein [Streptantibioticus silvisoli]MDI5967148.1 hypothetical protein [Streptantibioticus silvisoli]